LGLCSSEKRIQREDTPMNPPTRLSLLNRAQAGDTAAMNELLSVMTDFVVRCSMHMQRQFAGVIAALDAEAAASAALFNVYEAIRRRTFVHPGNGQHVFHRYVNRVVQNCFYALCRDTQRHNQPKGLPVQSLDAMPEVQVGSAEGGPADLAEARDRRELNETWCLSVASQSLARARNLYIQPTHDPDNADLRLLAWQGYCLLTFENLSREEVLDQLRARYPRARAYRARLTARWLSAEAHKIRLLNSQCFLEICADLGYDVNCYELREGLEALGRSLPLDQLRDSLGKAARGEDVGEGLASLVESVVQAAKGEEARDEGLRSSSQRLRASAAALSRSGGAEP
jgi:hypothetical protein